MTIDLDLLLYGAVFVGILLLVEAAYYLLRDWRHAPANAINRRLRLLAASDRHTALRRLRRDDHNAASRLLKLVFPFAERLLLEAGAASTLSSLGSAVAGIGLLVFVPLRFVLLFPLLQSAAIAAVVGTVLPFGLLLIKRRRRLRRFGEQLPDAIDVLVRSLRAGHPVSGAMGLVAEEMPDPIGTEFGLTLDEMTYGLSMEQALSNMARRVPHGDLNFLVVAIQIQHTTGGDLAEILANLATIIRDRFRMYSKIRAVSAEGRMAAKVIGGLPFFVAGALNALTPTFFGSVSTDPLFPVLMAVACVLWLVGIVIFMKMIRIRV
jgi:tight adherence protein B